MLSAALAIQVLGAILAFVNQSVLAHWLGVSRYGALATLVAISTIVGVVGTLGTTYAAMYFIPRYRQTGDVAAVRQYAEFSVRITVQATVVLSALVGVALLLATTAFTVTEVLALTGLSVATALVNFGNDVGRSVERFVSTYGAAIVLRPAVATVAILALWLAHNTGSVGVGLGVLCLAACLAFAVQARQIHASIGVFWARVGRARPKEWLRESPHYLMATGFTLLLFQADLLAVSTVLQGPELSRYAAATKCAGTISLSGLAVASFIAPEIAKLARPDSYAHLVALLRRAVRWCALLSIPSGLVMVVFAPEFLALFGSGFGSGRHAVEILVIGQVAVVIAVPANSVLIYSGHQRLAAGQFAVLSALSFLACILGAEVGGITGAATASSAVFVAASSTAFVLAARVLAQLRTSDPELPRP